MDTAREVLRFSIPGSITLLLVTAHLMMGRLLQGDAWSGIAEAVRQGVSAVVAIVAAVPLGFVIYQMYYSTYRAFVWPWPWPVTRDERWVRIDRGAQVLSRFPRVQLTDRGDFRSRARTPTDPSPRNLLGRQARPRL